MAKTAKKMWKVKKMKLLEKTLGGVAAKIVEDIKAVDDAWTQGVDVGRDCRMIDEGTPSTFGAPAKVVGQMGTKLKLQVEGLFHSVVCEVSYLCISLTRPSGSSPQVPGDGVSEDE